MLRIVLISFFILLIYSCTQEHEVSIINSNIPGFQATTATDNGSGYTVFYPPEQFVREEGKPYAITVQIGDASMSSYEDCFMLYVKNGGETGDFTSSAIVKVDGVIVLNTSDFKNSYELFSIELCNLTEESVLEVENRGTPGSLLEIWIEGILSVPTQGLLAYYPFNGNANDESGNGLDGFNHGSALTLDRFGQADAAYLFDGIDDYVDLRSPELLNITDEITIAAWINPLLSGTWGHPIVSKRSGPYSRSFDLVVYLNKEGQWGYANSGHQNLDVFNMPITAGSWHFIAATYRWYGTHGVLKYYLDNIKLAETTKNHQMLANPTMPVTIGTFGSQKLYFFNGVIDDVRIYDRELTEEEISVLYNE